MNTNDTAQLALYTDTVVVWARRIAGKDTASRPLVDPAGPLIVAHLPCQDPKVSNALDTSPDLVRADSLPGYLRTGDVYDLDEADHDLRRPKTSGYTAPR
jgi:hypothetical protein